MKKRGLLTLLGSLCLVFVLVAPSLAQVVKLTLADQNPQTGWGPMNAYTLPPDEQERWRKAGSEPVWKDWVKKMESKGRPEAQQVLNAALEMIKK